MKRGQFAQETSYVYGMVLIMVIMVLTAFVYMDVGNFSFTKRSDTCAFTSQIECEDFVYDETAQNITLSARNNMDFNIFNVTIEASGPCNGVGFRTAEDAILGLDQRSAVIVDIPCTLNKGTHLVYLTLNFTTAQDLNVTRQKQGYIRVRIT